MVVSASPYATNAGLAVLRDGGNAVDAAVAVAFTLAVTYPTAGNIGGGGFLVARINGQNVALDFREKAPGSASRDMYLDSTGQLTDRSLTGALAAGVPGSVAGLFEAHRKYGTKPWAELVQPAVELAEQGFVVDTAFSEDSEEATARLAKDSASAALFLRDGRFVAPGTRWRAPELAAVLRRIAEKGRDGFYAGETAASIVAAMQKSGGIISRADLAGYTPVWRSPVEFDYRGHHVVSMPPASSGGLTLALILGIVEGRDVASLGWRTGASIHLLAEAERRAFARRNALLGDPEFGPVATAAFLSKDTAAALRAEITDRASEGSSAPAAPEPRHTTHFSIVDARGNAVALTTTLNESYGAAFTVPGGPVSTQRRDGRLHHEARRGERDGIGAGRAQRDRAGQAHALEHDPDPRARFGGSDRAGHRGRRWGIHHHWRRPPDRVVARLPQIAGRGHGLRRSFTFRISRTRSSSKRSPGRIPPSCSWLP
jgi:gamma-glutamyltranspeptidase/glutathione hydrolase